MTPEQQKFWDILSISPEKTCHAFGRELKNIRNKKQFLKRADECFEFVMSNLDAESVVRIVKTWLCVYNLPFEPDKMKSFQSFHEHYGPVIMEKCVKNDTIVAF